MAVITALLRCSSSIPALHYPALVIERNLWLISRIMLRWTGNFFHNHDVPLLRNFSAAAEFHHHRPLFFSFHPLHSLNFQQPLRNELQTPPVTQFSLLDLILNRNRLCPTLLFSPQRVRPRSPSTSHDDIEILLQLSVLTMARNSEKAQSMLFRFRAAQAAESGLLPSASLRRPKAPSTVTTIPLCEKWRGQILKEVSRKVTKIQDESLSDFQVRDLNDEINKLMKEKWGWERRIRELGGPNYMRGGGTVFDDQGREVPGGGKGYRYFGRARELPGVKEMFERAAKRRVHGDEDENGGGKVKQQEINRRNLDAKYFGFGLDEEDGSLLKYERRKEKEAVERVGKSATEDEDDDWEPLPGDAGDGVRWRLPTLEEVQDELVNRRRRQLLDKLV